jgi:hypothetical protein
MVIDELVSQWCEMTEVVLHLENVDLGKLRKLFRETYVVVEEYSKEYLVPKNITELLLELNDFGWWVCDLEETPLHKFYQPIFSLTNALSGYFLTGVGDIEKIENAIEEITE